MDSCSISPQHVKGHDLDRVVTREGSCILRAEPDVFPSGVGDDAGHATLDHYAIGTHLQSRFPKPAVKAITYRKTKTIPIPEFRESVRCAVLSRNVDNLVMTYNTEIGNVLDNVIDKRLFLHARLLPGIHASCERRNKSQHIERAMRKKKKNSMVLSVDFQIYQDHYKEVN